MYRTKVEIDAHERVIAQANRSMLMAKRRDPQSHPPKVATRTAPVSMKHVMPRVNGQLRMRDDVRVASGGEDEWPTDVPVRIDVHRVIGVYNHDSAGPAEGMMGHIIDMDFFTKGQRVIIKLYRDPNGLAIEVNDEPVFYWTEDPSSRPVGYDAVMERLRQQDGDWASMVNLRHGDEVVEGQDGVPVIIRAEDEDDDPIIEDDDEWEE